MRLCPVTFRSLIKAHAPEVGHPKLPRKYTGAEYRANINSYQEKIAGLNRTAVDKLIAQFGPILDSLWIGVDQNTSDGTPSQLFVSTGAGECALDSDVMGLLQDLNYRNVTKNVRTATNGGILQATEDGQEVNYIVTSMASQKGLRFQRSLQDDRIFILSNGNYPIPQEVLAQEDSLIRSPGSSKGDRPISRGGVRRGRTGRDFYRGPK